MKSSTSFGASSTPWRAAAMASGRQRIYRYAEVRWREPRLRHSPLGAWVVTSLARCIGIPARHEQLLHKPMVSPFMFDHRGPHTFS